MCHTHATSDGDIKPGKLTFAIDNCNEAKVIGEDIDVVRRWYRDSDFELGKRNQ
jgi:hypothetical protein